MTPTLPRTYDRTVLFRIVADYLLVHACMLAAVQISSITTAKASPVLASEIVSIAARYYSFFWAISPLFPIVFGACGFYSSVRSSHGRSKLYLIARGVAVSLAVFVLANALLSGGGLFARQAAWIFSALMVVSVPIRLLVRLVAEKFWILPPASGELSAPKETVLVVGGAGYIGSLLVRDLIQSGRVKVRVVDNLTYGDGAIRDLLDHPDFELIVGDCRNIQSVVQAMKGVSSLVHLAAIVGDPACDQDQRSALEINYAATRMLIEVAKGHGVQRFVFASTCSVYGATDYVSSEDSPVQPISLYGRTKVESETAVLQARSANFHPTALRFATVFGLSPRPRFDLVVNLLTAKAKQDKAITIFNGEQWRPFIHVKDAARAIVAILNAPLEAVSGEAFNVGDSRFNHTLNEVAMMVRKEFPATRVEHVENSDRRNYRVAFDKIRRCLGFECTLSVEQGIQELKQALESGLVSDYNDFRYSNFQYLKATGAPANTNETDGRVMAAFAENPAVVAVSTHA